MFDPFGCGDSGFFITNIKKVNKNLFKIQVICNEYYHEDASIKINPGDEILLILEIDSDYLRFYLNDKNTLLKTYVKINEQTEEEINNFVKNIQG